jgi:hypothetical protein
VKNKAPGQEVDESPHLSRDQPIVRVDGKNRDLHDLPLGQQPDQSPVAQFRKNVAFAE